MCSTLEPMLWLVYENQGIGDKRKLLCGSVRTQDSALLFWCLSSRKQHSSAHRAWWQGQIFSNLVERSVMGQKTILTGNFQTPKPVFLVFLSLMPTGEVWSHLIPHSTTQQPAYDSHSRELLSNLPKTSYKLWPACQEHQREKKVGLLIRTQTFVLGP